ncbi:MAG: SDR family oxidoreductase [Terriglobia bacterium]
MMKIAITGAQGLFGHGLVQACRRQHTVFPLTRQDVDITDAARVEEVIGHLRPDVVIHAAAIPDPDVCEAEPAKAFQVNFHGTRNVAQAAKRIGAGVAYISSDAVFDGKKKTPYQETDPTAPPTVYGRTKLRGEEATRALDRWWVFRLCVMFGPGKLNFITKGLQRIQTGQEYVVAADQMGNAAYTLDAAAKILEVIEAGNLGLYHLANRGACDRLELARKAAELAGLDPARVVGKPSAKMGRRAVRLKYSVMAMDALQAASIKLPRPWQEALAQYIQTLDLRNYTQRPK